MKIFPHFVVVGFSNSYIIADDKTKTAVVIDPGIFDAALLNLIEKNNYYIKAVLVTHAHESHINGIKTLMKIMKQKYMHSETRSMIFPLRILKKAISFNVIT